MRVAPADKRFHTQDPRRRSPRGFQMNHSNQRTKLPRIILKRGSFPIDAGNFARGPDLPYTQYAPCAQIPSRAGSHAPHLTKKTISTPETDGTATSAGNSAPRRSYFRLSGRGRAARDRAEDQKTFFPGKKKLGPVTRGTAHNRTHPRRTNQEVLSALAPPSRIPGFILL